MRKKEFVNKVNIILFFIVLCFNFSIPLENNKWQLFNDSYDYLNQSHIPINEMSFFLPFDVNYVTSSKPFTIPLIFKLAQNDPVKIIQFQKYIHSVCILFLVYSLMLFINKTILKYAIMFFIYFFMSWWNIFGWTNLLVAESLFISFFFCWIASFLVMVKKLSNLSFITHFFITVLFSFTILSAPFLLILFYFILLLSKVFWDKTKMFKIIFLLSLCLTIFIINFKEFNFDNKIKVSIRNSIILRIVPNNDYLTWFSKQGMPCIENLKKEFLHLKEDDKYNEIKINKFYNTPLNVNFFDWINKKGEFGYFKFLISHPAYTFFFDKFSIQKRHINVIKLYSYIGTPQGLAYYFPKIFPIILFHPFFIVALCGFLMYFYLKEKKYFYIFPINIFLVFIIYFFLKFNLDPMFADEILFFNTIICQFIGLISSIILIEIFAQKFLISKYHN